MYNGTTVHQGLTVATVAAHGAKGSGCIEMPDTPSAVCKCTFQHFLPDDEFSWYRCGRAYRPERILLASSSTFAQLEINAHRNPEKRRHLGFIIYVRVGGWKFRSKARWVKVRLL